MILAYNFPCSLYTIDLDLYLDEICATNCDCFKRIVRLIVERLVRAVQLLPACVLLLLNPDDDAAATLLPFEPYSGESELFVDFRDKRTKSC